MIKTYMNRQGTPIIRKCGNCVNYKSIEGTEKSGYCKIQPMLFAFTHEQSVYAIVKDFYLCSQHFFTNEETLAAESEQVDLLTYLTERNAKKKQI